MATTTYVAASCGQRVKTKMQIVRIIVAGDKTIDGIGKSSATVIPAAAISARPTNGWRSAVTSIFTQPLFAYRAFTRQAAIANSKHRYVF